MVFHHIYHVLVKCSQVLVFQFRIIYQRPLPAAIIITPVIAFPREVNPFGMTEFIPHKVHIGLSSQRNGTGESFYARPNPGQHHIVVVSMHMEIHFLVHQAECQGFIAYKCLVMRFSIGNRFNMDDGRSAPAKSRGYSILHLFILSAP